MKDQPIYIEEMIWTSSEHIDRLQPSLEFVKACFKYLPFESCGPLGISLTFYGYEDLSQVSEIAPILEKLKASAEYQTRSGKEIRIAASVEFRREIIFQKKTIDIFYIGTITLHNRGGWIYYNWYQNTPTVFTYLREDTKGTDILEIYHNFQAAVADQIEKNYGSRI